MNQQQRLAVLEEANSWLHTPYHCGQRLKGVGVDCIQFLIGVYANAGVIEPIETGYYSPDWHLHRSEERYLSGVRERMISTQTPLAGDIALFRYGRTVSHGGILLDEHRIIHSFYKTGVTITNLSDVELKERLDSYWTLKEE